jgi:hypothetical protein
VIREITGRGVAVRRLRVVSEPVTDYIRFEHATTGSNIDAGEQVRWLPRRRTADLLLPGCDCWVFDGRRVLLSYFHSELLREIHARLLVSAEAGRDRYSVGYSPPRLTTARRLWVGNAPSCEDHEPVRRLVREHRTADRLPGGLRCRSCTSPIKVISY